MKYIVTIECINCTIEIHRAELRNKLNTIKDYKVGQKVKISHYNTLEVTKVDKDTIYFEC